MRSQVWGRQTGRKRTRQRVRVGSRCQRIETGERAAAIWFVAFANGGERGCGASCKPRGGSRAHRRLMPPSCFRSRIDVAVRHAAKPTRPPLQVRKMIDRIAADRDEGAFDRAELT